MAKNQPSISANKKEWQIESDAYTLIEAEKIKLDNKRLADAQKKAADIIQKQTEEAKKSIQVAKNFTKTKSNTKSKGKK